MKRKEKAQLKHSVARSELGEKLDAKMSQAEKRKVQLIDERVEKIKESPSGTSPRRRTDSGGSAGARSANPSGCGERDLLPSAVEPPPPRARNEKSIKKRLKRIRLRMAGCSFRGDSKLPLVDLTSDEFAAALDALSIAKPIRKLYTWFVAAAGSKVAPNSGSFESIVGAILKKLRERTGSVSVADAGVLCRLLIETCATYAPPSLAATDLPQSSDAPPGRLPLKSIVLGLTVLDVALNARDKSLLPAVGTGDAVLKLIDTFVRVVPGVYAVRPAGMPSGPCEPDAAAIVAKLAGKVLFELIRPSDIGLSAQDRLQAVDDTTMCVGCACFLVLQYQFFAKFLCAHVWPRAPPQVLQRGWNV